MTVLRERMIEDLQLHGLSEEPMHCMCWQYVS